MRRMAIVPTAGAAACLLLLGATPTSSVSHELHDSPISSELQVRPRDVRVLIVSDADAIRIIAAAPPRIECHNRQEPCSVPTAPELSFRADHDVIRSAGTETFATQIDIHPAVNAPLQLSSSRGGDWSLAITYPGDFRVTIDDGGLAVVNFVDVEEYVSCVVAGETWPNFSSESFRTQAIVSRTFVLYQMSRATKAAFDVSATQGSQVYRGLRNDAQGRLATDAAEYTRGIVCTFNDGTRDRMFCTYYSAACGGISQSAAALGPEGNVPPLSGGIKCDYCKIAPPEVYRWGPVRIPASDVLSRLASRYPEFESFRQIASIVPTERTPSGRPIALKIQGQGAESRTLLAERFRLAVGGSIVKSTDCQIRVNGGDVIFDKGKGYGHGLGLCQWGAQGQALERRHAAEILRYYYPGSKLARAY
ncbi:MAG: SpoIID/LytB domain-containing protein [Planctomycetes bacterium]|nr:SpoIID/LytB domain-containing protein [Planctomycetota bacterium]MBI3835867.1 SpoIID/LytB domain-containing protein [Planctomycetota bacterium]